jgi:RNA polymerase sigma-70 factor (ECF subfamily)
MSSSGNVDPESHTEAGFIQKNIDKAIEKLSKRERTIFVMRNYSGLSFGEIVKILKLRPGTVRSTNFKALEKLRKELAFYKDEI